MPFCTDRPSPAARYEEHTNKQQDPEATTRSTNMPAMTGPYEATERFCFGTPTAGSLWSPMTPAQSRQ